MRSRKLKLVPFFSVSNIQNCIVQCTTECTTRCTIIVATQCTYLHDAVYRNFQPNVQKCVIYKLLPKRHFHAAETQRSLSYKAISRWRDPSNARRKREILQTLAGRHFRAAEACQTFKLLRSSISLPRLPYSLGRGTFALQLQIELSFPELSTPYGHQRTCSWLPELKRTSQGTWNSLVFVLLIS